MKKTLLFVLAAIFACYTMNAQVLFSDDFEGDLSAWTLYDEDGDGNNWAIFQSSDGISIHGGSQGVRSESYINNVGPLTPDNWMVTTNAITVPEAGYTLTWYDAAQSGAYPSDKYSVYVSTTGNTVADFTAEPVITVTLSTDSWTMRNVDFSAYAGQSIYIAFRHYDCTDWFWFKIDDLELAKPLTTPEISLSRLTVPATVDVNTPFTMSGVVTNPSTVALTSFKVSYTLDGENSGDITISGINVPLGGTYAFSHTAPAFVTEGGVHNFSITVSEPNGEADYTGDNTLSGTFLACGVPISTFPYVEEYETGDFGCWQVFDEDGDGDNWEYINLGIGGAWSISYNATPDNWLVSPAIQIPQTGEYYAAWFDACYTLPTGDNYSYYVATTPTVAAFEAAGALGNITDLDTNFTDRYQSLAEFAGQTIYFAIRHHNSDGNMAIYFVDFQVFNPSAVLDTIEVVSANETMGTVTGGGVFEDGTEITISATPNAGYRFVRWNDNNTDNPRTIVCEGNATYTAYFELIPTTGINDVNAADVKLFPNPTSGNLYVEVEGLQKVEIIDAVGRVVLSQNNGTVNMSNLANGIYTVRVSANGTTSIKKVVKK